MSYLRTVVEEPRFTQDVDRFREKYPRIDEVHEALTWDLARRPSGGTPLDKFPDYRVYTTTEIGDTPAFWVLYSFDEYKVYLMSIEPVRSTSDD